MRYAAVLAFLALLVTQVAPPFAGVAYADDAATSTPTVVAAIPLDTATSSPEDAATTTPDVSIPADDAATSTPALDPVASTTPPDLSVATTSVESISTQNASTTVATDVPDAVGTSTTATSTGPVIESGSAVALANILNLVNTNFVNSTGSFQFSNFTDPVTGLVDLRSLAAGTDCSLAPCVDGASVGVTINNDASIDNELLVQAATGDNAISGTGSTSAAIATGDAYAGLNLINVANTDFIDSQYLLVTINAFAGVSGDIVFPSLASFLTGLGGGVPTLDITNAGTIANNLTTTADAGGNDTGDASTSAITTGASDAYSNIFNQLNATLASSAATILLRVSGSWSGQVYGAPSTLVSTEEPGGSYLLSTALGANGTPDTGSVTSSSTALIANNVGVAASTGQNAITDASTALVSTGNAYAGANIVNIANDTIVSNNWILAIINVFGDFTGNIDFGLPDLWIGDQVVDAPSPVEPGAVLDYKFSVINNGDADATNVVLTDTHDASQLQVLTASVPYATSSDGVLSWDLGTIPAGKAVEVSYTGEVTAGAGTNVVNQTAVTEDETDNNPADNSDSMSVSVEAPPAYTAASFIPPAAAAPVAAATTNTAPTQALADATTTSASIARISIVRTPVTHDLTGTSTVHESLVLQNETDTPATNVTLDDIVSDPSGALLQDEPWDIGTIGPNEEVDIGYDLAFSAVAPSGEYSIVPHLAGDNVSLDASQGTGFVTLEAAPALPSVGKVLGISTTKAIALPKEASATSIAAATTTAQDPNTLDTIFAPPTALAASAAYGAEGSSYGLLDALVLVALLALYGISRVYMRLRRNRS